MKKKKQTEQAETGSKTATRTADVGERMRKVRKSRHMGQAQLAKYLSDAGLKVSRKAVSSWETGQRTTPSNVLVKIGEIAEGEDSLWFWERAGVKSRAMAAIAQQQAAEYTVHPKEGEMVRVPPHELSSGIDLLLPRQFVPSPGFASYFVVREGTKGYPFLLGDVFILDESSKAATSLTPFWDQVVIVDSTGDEDEEHRAGLGWDQLVGRLALKRERPEERPHLAHWRAVLVPWSVLERLEPYTVGRCETVFPINRFPIEHSTDPAQYKAQIVQAEKKAESEARKLAELTLQIDPGLRILGRVIGWFRPVQAPKSEDDDAKR